MGLAPLTHAARLAGCCSVAAGQPINAPWHDGFSGQTLNKWSLTVLFTFAHLWVWWPSICSGAASSALWLTHPCQVVSSEGGSTLPSALNHTPTICRTAANSLLAKLPQRVWRSWRERRHNVEVNAWMLDRTFTESFLLVLPHGGNSCPQFGVWKILGWTLGCYTLRRKRIVLFFMLEQKKFGFL